MTDRLIPSFRRLLVEPDDVRRRLRELDAIKQGVTSKQRFFSC